jgi:hypothetical protein
MRVQLLASCYTDRAFRLLIFIIIVAMVTRQTEKGVMYTEKTNGK